MDLTTLGKIDFKPLDKFNGYDFYIFITVFDAINFGKKFLTLQSVLSQYANQNSNKIERYSKTNCAGLTGMSQGFQIYFV